MRLSLLDHEEHQRKEAEEKKKKAAAETSSDAGPSTAEPSASIPSPALEARSSSSPNHSRHPSNGNRDLLSSVTASRSRSPSPPGNSASIQGSSTWLRRASNPPPFSTLSAALSAATTASAVIAGPAASHDNSAPANIKPSSSPTYETQPSAETLNITGGERSTPSLRPTPMHQDSQASSVSSIDSQAGPATSYDELASSPDSDSSVAREPLIGTKVLDASVTPRAGSPSLDQQHPR